MNIISLHLHYTIAVTMQIFSNVGLIKAFSSIIFYSILFYSTLKTQSYMAISQLTHHDGEAFITLCVLVVSCLFRQRCHRSV